MNRLEFLTQLRAYLYTAPPEEREAAMQFYAEYFDDAGPENEQRVIAELGSPQKLGRQILQGCDERYIPPAYAPVQRGNKKGVHWWQILIGVFAFPILFPLLAVLAVLAVTAVVTAVILAAALAVVVVALLVGGFVGFFVWLAGLGGVTFSYMDVPGGIVGLGFVLISLGLGLLLIRPAAAFFTRGIPRIVRAMGDGCRRLTGWMRRGGRK